MRRLLVGLLVLALTGCGGLALPDGVRDAGEAAGEQAESGGIVVVAPGPQPGMSAVELVNAFLYALSRSPQDDHATARQFLAPGVECCDGSGEAVLYPVSARSITVGADPSVVRVTFGAVGRIRRDGSYRLEDTQVQDTFSVVPVEDQLRLASVPDGLRLLEDDLERSFTPYDVHFLGRAPDGAPTGRLVPDRVFLPATGEPAQALVDAVLRGPSRRLAPSVTSVAPAGTVARVTTEAGVATVDLSAQVRALDMRDRQRLSAQLVWTLTSVYSGVRLLVEGESLVVEGAPAVQERSQWSVYDPVGGDARAPLLYLRDRRLRSLDGGLERSAVTEGELPVDGAALSPATAELAVRTRLPSGVDEIRTGPLAGPFGDPVLSQPGLTSLSFGPGDHGLWVLQPGSPATVWLVPRAESAARPPQRVAYSRPAGSGPLTALRASRDGARMALVLGGRLHVGRIEPTGQGLRITDVVLVSRELVGVTDVAWQDGTTLVALGSLAAEEQLFPASIAVDGSSFSVVQRPLVGATAVEIAAAPRRPLVVAADVEGRRQLYRDDGTLFRSREPGSAPFYAG